LIAGFLLALTLTACRPRKEAPPTIEGPVEPLSAIKVADPAVAGQLVSGFHEVERNAWRWTAHEFAVTLRPPFTASQKGAILKVNFNLPDTVFSKKGPITLSARIGATALSSVRFDKPGPQTYTSDVPPSALAVDPLRIDFTTDKFIASGEADKRELALIVQSVALEAKGN